MIRVISIGTDRKLFEEKSPVLDRSLEYAKKMEELHIIVFSLKKHHLKFRKIGNLSIYPTSSISRLTYVLSAYRIGKEIILKNNFLKDHGVISTQDPFETGLVGLFLKTKFSLPLQIQIHTDFLSPYFKKTFLNKIRLYIAKKTLPKADGIRVVSQKIASSLEHFPNLKIQPEILPIFVDIEAIRQTPITKDLRKEFPEFNFLLFMASRITKEKRIDVAIRALKIIVTSFPQVGLIIAGEGSERSNLERLIKTLGLEKNVRFIGWQKDLISYYKTTDIFLVTSEFEGYGMTIVEALASGALVISSNVGIAGENSEIAKKIITCPVGYVNCFTQTILKYIKDDSLRELFKIEVKDSINKELQTKEEYLSKYIDLLEKIR